MSEATQPAARPATPDGASTPYGIVVGVDASPGSGHALAWAARRTDRFGPVRPIVAWQYPAGIWSEPAFDGSSSVLDVDFAELAREEAEKMLVDIPEGDRRALTVVGGPAGPVIVDHGATANLIVVGTRGRGALADNLLGSVSCHVVNHAPVPVAVVPGSAELADHHGRIVVGVDGSDNATRALRWAIDHAAPDSVVEAVLGWTHQVSTLPVPYAVPLDDAEKLASETLDRAVAEATEGLVEPSPTIERSLIYGDPRTALQSELPEADLLVLGARGHRGVAHLLLGSVTTALIHKPPITTVVVPDPERR